MSTIEKKRAELTKLVQKNLKDGFVNVANPAPLPAKPSKEDARRLAGLRMNYDLQDKDAISSRLCHFAAEQ